MNEILQTMMERCTIRCYTTEQVPDAVIEQILHTAYYSPNAGNRQTTQVVICQNAVMNEQLGAINRVAFAGRASIHNRVSETQPSIADDPNLTSSFYGAPTVITLFAHKEFRYAQADCWVMAGNIALAAYALGVGSCTVGRAEETFASTLGRQLQAEWGIAADMEARVHITLGYSPNGFPAPKPRKYPNPIVVR